ncbi:MAG: acetate kinase [Candidatus Gracilibacteria bacterium]
MLILVTNAGSSSLKFQLIESKKWKPIYKGHVDRIGTPMCEYLSSNCKSCDTPKIKTITQAFKLGMDNMLKSGIIKDLKEIKAIGHRVVHGGETHTQAVKITPKILKDIERLSPLAPLHNPPNIEGIKAAMKIMPKIPNIAVFDTAFHQTMPEKAFLYALPIKLYEKHKIRRYGFHGTSHKFVYNEAKKYLGEKKTRHTITCHLGNGASITAIKNGQVIDTSMGFTPLEGLIMGTRSGDMDPAIIFHLMNHLKLKPEEIHNMLNYQSGLKGIYGKSDVRDLRDGFFLHQEKKAKLALDMYCYRIAKYIGAYLVALGQLDTLIFTGGIGENAWYVRKWVCHYLKIDLNDKRNKETEFPNQKIIKIGSGKPIVLVIPTNEELQIAKETFLLSSPLLTS